MNKEYMYVKNKFIVENEKGNKEIIDYADNVPEVLIEENVLEGLEKSLGKAKNDFEEAKKDRKDSKLIKILGVIFLLCPIVSIMIFGILSGITAACGIAIATSPFLLFGGTLISAFWRDNEAKKNMKAIPNVTNFIEKEIELQKEKVSAMENEKTNEKESEYEEFTIKKVDRKQVFNALKNTLLKAKELGINEYKYLEDNIPTEDYIEEDLIKLLEAYAGITHTKEKTKVKKK